MCGIVNLVLTDEHNLLAGLGECLYSGGVVRYGPGPGVSVRF